MHDLQNKYNDLAKKIVKSQKRLKRKHPENHLLNMVMIDNMIMHCTGNFEKKYRGRDYKEGLNQYIEDLNNASKEF